VWPALFPPWNLTAHVESAASWSMALPLPSSPHWAPSTTLAGTGRGPMLGVFECFGSDRAMKTLKFVTKWLCRVGRSAFPWHRGMR